MITITQCLRWILNFHDRKTPIALSRKYHNIPKCSLFVTLKFCVSIVFSFSWGHFNSQEKLKTMLMQNFRVTNKEHYGTLWYFLEWAIYLLQNQLLKALFYLSYWRWNRHFWYALVSPFAEQSHVFISRHSLAFTQASNLNVPLPYFPVLTL